MADIFDQLAQQQNGAEQSAPSPSPSPSPSSQPAQPEASQSQAAPQGDIFDQLAQTPSHQNTTPGQPQAQSRQNEPGFLERAYETSGAKGMVELGKSVLQRPVDHYHEMIDAYHKGDYKGAAEAANKIIYGQTLTKDNPFYKAASGMLSQIVGDAKASREAAQQGDVLGTIEHGAAAIPVVGGIAKSIGEPLGTDLGSGGGSTIGGTLENANIPGAAGDIVGPLLTLGIGKGLGALGKAMDGSSLTKYQAPRAGIEGADMTYSALHTPDAPGMAKMFASPNEAQKFIENTIQPQAVKATTANFSRGALDAIDDARALRGDPPLTTQPVNIRSVDDLVDNLQREAKVTYKKLDDAVEPEIKQWQNAKEQWERDNPKPQTEQPISPTTKQPPTQSERAAVKAQRDAWQNAKDDWDEANPKPKTFTELQDQINDAKATIESKGSSQVDKDAAIKALPEHEQEMQDYVDKYGDVVHPDELKAANGLWFKSSQYKYIANRVRTATKGTTGATSRLGMNQKPMQLTPSSLESIPAAFDNKYGAGSWNHLLGPDGVSNYNDILNALRNPVTKGVPLQQFLEGQNWLSKLKVPVSYFVDNMLFHPDFGQAVLKQWQNAGKATAAAGTAVKAGGVTGLATMTDDQKRRVMQGAMALQ